MLIDILYPRHCYLCGQKGQYICKKCLKKIKINSISPDNLNYEGRLSLFRYDAEIRSLIRDLKYNFVTDISDELAYLVIYHLRKYYKNLLTYWQKDDFIITPIPQHFLKTNFRGFSPNNLIIQKIAKKLKLKFDLDILKKSNDTLPQANFNKKIDRLTNQSHSFILNKPVSSNIIIFDDVFTTGSTIRSAIDILPKNKKIWVFTIAG